MQLPLIDIYIPMMFHADTSYGFCVMLRTKLRRTYGRTNGRTNKQTEGQSDKYMLKCKEGLLINVARSRIEHEPLARVGDANQSNSNNVYTFIYFKYNFSF